MRVGNRARPDTPTARTRSERPAERPPRANSPALPWRRAWSAELRFRGDRVHARGAHQPQHAQHGLCGTVVYAARLCRGHTFQPSRRGGGLRQRFVQHLADVGGIDDHARRQYSGSGESGDTNTAGLVNTVGGVSAGLEPPPNPGADYLLFSLSFQAVEAGTFTFTPQLLTGSQYTLYPVAVFPVAALDAQQVSLVGQSITIEAPPPTVADGGSRLAQPGDRNHLQPVRARRSNLGESNLTYTWAATGTPPATGQLSAPTAATPARIPRPPSARPAATASKLRSPTPTATRRPAAST